MKGLPSPPHPHPGTRTPARGTPARVESVDIFLSVFIGRLNDFENVEKHRFSCFPGLVKWSTPVFDLHNPAACRRPTIQPQPFSNFPSILHTHTPTCFQNKHRSPRKNEQMQTHVLNDTDKHLDKSAESGKTISSHKNETTYDQKKQTSTSQVRSQ